jgi:tetratricopeptide (TPR) repeat protein
MAHCSIGTGLGITKRTGGNLGGDASEGEINPRSSTPQAPSNQSNQHFFDFSQTFLIVRLRNIMPITYNGVGTHYYGKSNVESRTGSCQFCGRETALTSYNTRLWFVVFFIPVIPLGKKRIIEYCSACRRHYAVDLKKWETSKQLEISGALDKYRTNPTAESGIALHQQLLNFHQMAQAADFRKELIEKFGGTANVQCYLGAALEHQGKYPEAAAHYAKALELRPDLPDARVGVALDAIRHGRLSEARTLLDFLDKPGSGQLYSLEPLELLGNALQKTGDHADALKVFNRILEEIPAAAQHKAFRKKIEASEKALGQKQTVLPKKKFSWRQFFHGDRSTVRTGPVITKRGLIIFGSLAGAAAITMISGNVYVRKHRTVEFINGLNEAEKISVDGNTQFTLQPRQRLSIEFAEGPHKAMVSGAVTNTISFEIKAKSYFSRWWDKPVWVVNPDSAALLVYQEVTYAQDAPPARVRFFIGQPVIYLPEVSHPFTSLPQSVKVSQGSSRELQHLDQFRQPPVEAFYYLISQKRNREAVDVAETHLKAAPGDEELLHAYLRELRNAKEISRAESMLKDGLRVRPVQITWHRTYQDVYQRRSGKADLTHDSKTELISLYDSFLTKEPENSALVYLRGRLCTNPEEGASMFNKAIKLDPKNAYAHYALGYKFWSAGNWADAKPLLATALELRPEDDSFRKYYYLARLGTGETETLEKDLRARIAAVPLDLFSVAQLIDLLASQDRAKEIETVISTAQQAIRRAQPEAALRIGAFLNHRALYAAARFEELEKAVSKDLTAEGRGELFQALVEQNKLSQAETIRPISSAEEDDPYHFLSFSLACHAAGDVSKAKEWMDQGIKRLKEGSVDTIAAAKLLTADSPPSDLELASLSTGAREKAILAATLQYLHPAQAKRFGQLARQLNVERVYPYHLIQRITSSAQ